MNRFNQAFQKAEQQLDHARQRWQARSATEKAIVDDGFMTPFVLCCVLLIWAVELTANLRNGITGWIDLSHLFVIGSLELLLGGYLFFAVLRKWTLRRQLVRAEKTYHFLKSQRAVEPTRDTRDPS